MLPQSATLAAAHPSLPATPSSCSECGYAVSGGNQCKIRRARTSPSKAATTLLTGLQAEPDLRIDSPGMCRALFEVYLGGSTVVPEAKAAWAKGARQLLDSEEVRRASRRGGSG